MTEVQTKDIEYSYKAVPTIRRFSQSRKFIRGLMGPFGSGKSSGCCIDLIQIANRQVVQDDGKRRARFALIRNTYGQLEDTTMRTFFEWLPHPDFGHYIKSEHRYIIDRLDPDIEIEILFRALDRQEHISKLLSLELTAAWVNEAREVPWAVIRALMGRVGRYPKVVDGGCVDPCLIMDTNPPDDESDWYEFFEELKPENAEIFKQPSGRAPDAENLAYLPPNYYQNMMSGADQDFIKVYVDGRYGYVKEGKPIYPDYNDQLHCRDIEPMEGIPIKRGWDFGITPACAFTQVLPDGRWLVFDEMTAEDLGIKSFGNAVLMHCAQKYAGFKFEDYGDPSGEARKDVSMDQDEQTCFQILHGQGILVQASLQNLIMRLESVKLPMNSLVGGKPQLIVHSRCKKIRKGMQGRYQYKKMKIVGSEERYQDTPDKNSYSHIHDALQYVAVKIFGDAVKSKADKVKKERDKYAEKRRRGSWMSA